MKQISKSLATIVALAVMAVGLTSSYFSDTEIIAGNNFVFGTLDLVVSEESLVPVSLGDMKPGDSIEKVIDIRNDGSLDFGSLRLTSQPAEDNGGILSQLEMSMRFVSNLGTDQEYKTFLDAEKIDSISSLDLIRDDVYYEGNPADMFLRAGNVGQIVLTITAPTDLGNSYQGLNASFDLSIYAEQIH